MKNNLYKSILTCSLWVLICGISFAQSIDSAEYFFDTDPGAGKGFALAVVPSDSVVDTVYAVPAGLPSGFHTVFIRMKDTNNVWSLYEGLNFYVYDTIVPPPPSTDTIISAEYFYDTDPGTGNGTLFTAFSPGDSVTITDTLPTAPLTAGIHALFVRVKDRINRWSLYEGISFAVCNFVPQADFSADTVCLNTPTIFTDLSANLDTSKNYTYEWDFDNNGSVDDTTRGSTSHVFSTSGTHTVTLVVNNTTGCVDTIIKTIYVDSLPTVTLTLPLDTLCRKDTLVLAGGNPAGGVYSGTGIYNGVLMADSLSKGFHTVTYTYYNSDSCSAKATASVYISLCTGVDELQAADYRIQVHPNPFREFAILEIASEGSSIPKMEIEIRDVFGKEVQTMRIETRNTRIERRGMAGGIYFFRIVSGMEIIGTGKLVIAD